MKPEITLSDCIHGLRDLHSREFAVRSDPAGFILLDAAMWLERQRTMVDNLRGAIAEANRLMAEKDAALADAQKGYKEIQDLLEGIESDAQDKDTPT